MSKKERVTIPKVNFFDGQNVTQLDLETEQSRSDQQRSTVVIDFHGSGVIVDSPFESKTLFDTRYPGKWSEDGENPSESDIQTGTYDGKAIYLDRQPSDIDRGNRVSLNLVSSAVAGRKKTKVMILGKAFDGLGSGGKLVTEFIEFEKNETKLSSFYYLEIIAIYFNHFSGGSGSTYSSGNQDSHDLISETSGYMIISEAEPLSVFPYIKQQYQVESPNFDFNTFITSSSLNSLEDEIEDALGGSNSLSALYIEKDGNGDCTFEKNGSTAVAYGQKFLGKTNNIQSVDFLLSVEEDSEQPEGEEFNFSGNIVVGIYELTTDAVAATDSVPNSLIDFDPEISPMLEISLNQSQLESLGYKLNSEYRPVRFSFSNTLIANPNIDPSIVPGKYYAILVSRRGNNQVGTLNIKKGFDKASKKEDLGVPLFAKEQFAKQETKFFEYDPATKRYVNDSQSSLWFSINSDGIEVVDGAAYLENGKRVTLPKTELYVGKSEVSRYYRNIPLSTIVEGAENYAILGYRERFSDIITHPITNNAVASRVYEEGDPFVVNQDGLDDLVEDYVPVILGKINDNNVRSAETIFGVFDKPGLIQNNKIVIVNPNSTLLDSNLIGRVITPDTDCSCNAKYRIIKTECKTVLMGDLNADGKLSSADITLLLNVAGNTINSESTERSILGGSLDLLDFIKSDLNGDDTVDGTDIELLENAVDGYENFSVPASFKILEVYLENIFEEDDFPQLFIDNASTGTTVTSSNELSFQTTEEIALAIRVGDTVEIESLSVDAGTYIIATKSVAEDAITVSLTVTDLAGDEVSFSGDTGFNVTVVSGTEVNIFADNNELMSVPFVSKNFKIEFVSNIHFEKFIEVCDLRRFVHSSFLELKNNNCLCVTTDCSSPEICSPAYKNQTYIPGDLYMPNGNIMTSPGVPHPGDFEYVNITMPLPPGTLDGCSVNLYNTFIKAENGGCKTAAGYPAMKYSDGTYVGCEDDESNTDIAKGRVKFSQSIASLHVDAFIDGYAVDGEEDDELAVDSVEHIYENYEDLSYNRFDAWTEDISPAFTNYTITNNAGPNEGVKFDLTTTTDATLKFARVSPPVAAQDLTGDFVIDIVGFRDLWPENSLTSGTISSYATLSVDNVDSSSAVLKFGWRVTGGGDTKLFFSGEILNTLSVVVETFDFEVDVPDSLGDDVIFRFRRTDDVISAYYVTPGNVAVTTISSFGQFVRIGTNPAVQPGSGPVTLTLEMNQETSPNAGLLFRSLYSEVIYMTEYETDNATGTMTVGKDALSLEASRATITFPLSFSKKTNIVSATLKIVPTGSGTNADTFDIIPLDIINASNLGLRYNYPEGVNPETFSPGTYVSGTPIDVDITSLINTWLVQSGHLPGYKKALIIQPQVDVDSSFEFDISMELLIAYEDITTGVIFKVGVNIDPTTGIATFNTKNILYDASVAQNRTVLNFGVYLKKSGFKNSDISVGMSELSKIGIGNCYDQDSLSPEDQCYFVVGTSGVGVFVEGPFDCLFQE